MERGEAWEDERTSWRRKAKFEKVEYIFVYWNSYAVASGIGVVACKELICR